MNVVGLFDAELERGVLRIHDGECRNVFDCVCIDVLCKLLERFDCELFAACVTVNWL